MEPIILASASPRRQQILKMLNIPFIAMPADISEVAPPEIEIEKASEYIAEKKVQATIDGLPEGNETPWILGADTSIIFEDQIYGKPANQDEAFDFIKKFQGKKHLVTTGIALYNGRKRSITCRISKNIVHFNSISDEEIEWYISTGEWHGAAGAYRIQGFASCFISKIEGTESSIMGLPLFELYDMLKEQGYSLIE